MGRKEIQEFLTLGSTYDDQGNVVTKCSHQEWIDKYVRMSALCREPTLYATGALTFKVLTGGIQGSLVECGVFAGAHPAVMHYCMRFCGQFRKIFMFDSYGGIPYATAEDLPTDDHPGENQHPDVRAKIRRPGEPIVSSGISVVSLEEVRARMAMWGADESDLIYVEGWFQNTVPVTDTGPLAILRLDGDEYESTKVCMDHLYPKLSPGGFCIIDDWRLAGCRRALDEYFTDEDGEVDLPNVIEIPGGDGPVFWRKPVRA